MVIISRRWAGVMPPLLDALATVVPRSDSERLWGVPIYTHCVFCVQKGYL
jgi:hypothetical protein